MKATQTVQIIIEKSKDAFWAYASGLEGVTGVGETVQLAKESVIESVDIQKELGNIPNVDYNFTFNFDVESLLNYYKGIFTNSALEKITGINQKQLQHYASGLKKPREAQIYKIEIGLHRLAEELLAVKL
ncbi:type II toxin-antitoxin system HicB family antitoxin [Daejeonella sp.]|uniref:type II toxin-antitoxin system HicB family antitoxin n=1 Tax=Daejeonella sp. TaxID=2805397 RepID=UPI0027200ABE|nr:type II toxin-antitoxin system HicB family antitoxin [Daejeonella sp.]MDO8993084.1 type II toxin-antitoxin system HicB family antitoxin [Daejeonella sp.]MDP2413187.1 type II toxin-antitoxin system HicB family antitoxin [Daejeonella sp.]